MAEKKSDFLTYKGKPLVRSGNTIYYGNMSEPYVVMLQIKSSEELKDITLAKEVTIQLLATDETLKPKEKVIKRSEKQGLYNALDLGAVWLHRALK